MVVQTVPDLLVTAQLVRRAVPHRRLHVSPKPGLGLTVHGRVAMRVDLAVLFFWLVLVLVLVVFVFVCG